MRSLALGYGYPVNEHNPKRPWLVVRTSHGRVTTHSLTTRTVLLGGRTMDRASLESPVGPVAVT